MTSKSGKPATCPGVSYPGTLEAHTLTQPLAQSRQNAPPLAKSNIIDISPHAHLREPRAPEHLRGHGSGPGCRAGPLIAAPPPGVTYIPANNLVAAGGNARVN